MKRWLKRLGYFTLFLLWLCIMILPCVAFSLVSNGQLQWGDDPENQVRVFLLQEADQEGVGFQYVRPDEEFPACIRSSVRYIMLEGEGDSTNYCECSAAFQGNAAPEGCVLP